MNGKLFAFEGIDDSGKTTQIQILSERLAKIGLSIFVSKATRDEVEGSKHLLLSFLEHFGFRKDSIPTMLLFQALHSKQYEEAKKALKEGRIILADRWNASFWVYHSNFGPLREKPKILEILDELAFQGLVPNVTLLLDLPVEIALERKRLQFRRVCDIFEQEELSVFKKAREAYLEMASTKSNWIIIDATKSIPEVHLLVWEIVAKELNLRTRDI